MGRRVADRRHGPSAPSHFQRGGSHGIERAVASGLPAAGCGAGHGDRAGAARAGAAPRSTPRDASRCGWSPRVSSVAWSRDDGPAPFAEAVWYTAAEPGAGLTYRCPVGALAGRPLLTADLLVDAIHLTVFSLELLEADTERVFRLTFAALPQCSARMRMRTEAVDQNRWRYPREGAWLKPMAGGDRVDLARVDRIRIAVQRKSERPGALLPDPPHRGRGRAGAADRAGASEGPPARRAGPEPAHDVAGRSRDAAEVTARLEGQLEDAPGAGLARDASAAGAAGRSGASRPPGSSAPSTTGSDRGWSTPGERPSGRRAWTACGSTPPPATTGWRRR